jgi:hypothetical protein
MRTAEKIGPVSTPDPGTVTLSKFEWQRVRFDTIIYANVWVRNTMGDDMKDIVIDCEEAAPSGTVIGHPSTTIYETVKAGATRQLHADLGFINQQTERTRCWRFSFFGVYNPNVYIRPDRKCPYSR